MARKKFKVQEVINAMKRNGFKHIRGSWVSPLSTRTNSGKSLIGAACISGQAAINLGVEQFSLRDALNELGTKHIGDRIIEFNDDSYVEHTYAQCVDFSETLLSRYRDDTIEIEEYDWNRTYDVEESRKLASSHEKAYLGS